MDPDARLRQIARSQGGAFRRRDAYSAGLTPGEVRGRLRRRQWLVMHRGVYSLTAEWKHATPERRLLLRASAAVLAYPESLISHHTAVSLLGLPVVGGTDAQPVHLTRPGFPRTPKYYPGVIVHAAGRPTPAYYFARLPGTPPDRTLIDLARWSPPLTGLAAIDHALHTGLVSPADLRRTLAHQDAWPWADRAGRVLELASPLSESPGESFSRLFFVEQGIEQPVQQVTIRRDGSATTARVDFFWNGRRPVIGEFDGLTKYDDPQVLRDEKLRQEWLEEQGNIVVRWTWGDLSRRAGRTRRRILAALERRNSY